MPAELYVLQFCINGKVDLSSIIMSKLSTAQSTISFFEKEVEFFILGGSVLFVGLFKFINFNQL